MVVEKNNIVSHGVASATVLTKNRLCVVGAAGLLVLPAAGGDVLGVAMENSPDGTTLAVPVAVFDGGIYEVEAGAAIAVGAALETGADGRVITAGGVTDRLVGYAMQASSAAGEFINVRGSKAAGFVAQA